MILNFKQFVEGGQGSGTKFTATGAGAGGQAQGGMGMSKPASPTVVPPSEFSPSDTVPAGYKSAKGPGVANSEFPAPLRKSGISGAGIRPPYQEVGKLKGGSFGGGSPQSKMKKMKKS